MYYFPLKWVFNNPKLCARTMQPHCTFAWGSWCFPNSLLSELALECDSMLFPFQLKGSWGYKGIWLIGQNPVRFAENRRTAKGGGVRRRECVNCGAQDHSKGLLNDPSPGRTAEDRRGGPRPDLPERGSCELLVRIQLPGFRELRGAGRAAVGELLGFPHHGAPPYLTPCITGPQRTPGRGWCKGSPASLPEVLSD